MIREKNKSIFGIILIAIILEGMFWRIQNIMGIVGIAVMTLGTIFYLLEMHIYDLVLILMPCMFYLNIGGSVNTSLADIIIIIWLLGEMSGRHYTGKIRKNSAITQTRIYMMRYAVIIIGIMMISMVNFIRWENVFLIQALVSIFKILVCMLYSLFTLFYIDIYSRKRFLCVMAYSTLFFELLMIVGVVAYTQGIDLGLTFAGTFRATGTFEDPNLASAYLFLMFSLASAYFIEEKKCFLLGMTFLLTVVGVTLTSSKGALVALVAGSILILLVNIIRGNRKIALILFMVFLFLCGVFYFCYRNIYYVQLICAPIFARLHEFTGNIGGDQTLQFRQFLWKTAFKLGMLEPILGVGVEQFRPAATQYTGEYVWNIVHNTYLTFFCELGVVGFIAFFRLWIKNAWNHFILMKKNISSVFYVFSIICVSVSMWSISLGNFRTLWVFMTFMLYEYNRQKVLVGNDIL